MKKIFAVSLAVLSLTSVQAFASSAGYGPNPSDSDASYGPPSDSGASYGPAQSDSGASYGPPQSDSGASYGPRQLPPVSVTPKYPQFNSNDIYWVRMNARRPIPARAVIGGRQPNQPRILYVCRAQYQNGLHPGKLVADNCNISWGGREIPMSRYEILVSRVPVVWVSARNGFVPRNAIPGGYEGSNTLFICQANYRGGVHTGKVVGNNCNFGWGGDEVMIPNYRVLTASL